MTPPRKTAVKHIAAVWPQSRASSFATRSLAEMRLARSPVKRWLKNSMRQPEHMPGELRRLLQGESKLDAQKRQLLDRRQQHLQQEHGAMPTRSGSSQLSNRSIRMSSTKIRVAPGTTRPGTTSIRLTQATNHMAGP